MKKLENYGLTIPKILLPNEKINLEKWAVIACDQFTQDRDYWKKVEDFVGNEESTLKITLPEVYLNDGDKESRIENINSTMEKYLNNGVFAKPIENMIYIERKTAYGRIRRGLIAAIDLEKYDWNFETKAMIRATEATILERIPPRVEIRKNASVELPHIMLLVNDKDKSFIEKTGELAKKQSEKPLYQTNLMMNSGSISSWKVDNSLVEENILPSLEKIATQQSQNDESKNDENIFMFAVGDGNHSLATAKTIWNKLKENGAPLDSPARYALVEIVNIYDEGLTFEPIHRVLFNTDAKELLENLAANLGGKLVDIATEKELQDAVENSNKNCGANFGFVYSENDKSPTGIAGSKETKRYTLLKTDITDLAVSHLQPALDEFLAKHGNKKDDIDYIHGSDEVFRLGGAKSNGSKSIDSKSADDVPSAISILLPPIAKDSFFSTIAKSGSLPRKSFSMGEASEKRFYMESRKIK